METVKLGIILAIFCIVSAGALAKFNMMTAPVIKEYKAKMEEEARREVLAITRIDLMDIPDGTYEYDNNSSDEKNRESMSLPIMGNTLAGKIECKAFGESNDTLIGIKDKIIGEWGNIIDLSFADEKERRIVNIMLKTLTKSFAFTPVNAVKLTIETGTDKKEMQVLFRKKDSVYAADLNGTALYLAEVKDGFKLAEKENTPASAAIALSNGAKIIYAGETLTASSFYECTAGSKLQGVVMKVAPQGYAGAINILVGIGNDGTVTGAIPLSHAETPGLGARMQEVDPEIAAKLQEKFSNKKMNIHGPWFMEQFKGLSADSCYVTKDNPQGKVDAITAATISSRAVALGVKEALDTFKTVYGR